MEAIFACMVGLSESANSNMLSEIFREQRVLPFQSNLGKISQNCSEVCHNFGSVQTTFGICVQRIGFGSLNFLTLNTL